MNSRLTVLAYDHRKGSREGRGGHKGEKTDYTEIWQRHAFEDEEDRCGARWLDGRLIRLAGRADKIRLALPSALGFNLPAVP